MDSSSSPAPPPVPGVQLEPVLYVPCAAHSNAIKANQVGQVYNFRLHQQFVNLSGLFRVINLHSLTAEFTQASVIASSSQPRATQEIRCGPIPRDLPVQDAKGNGLVGSIPSLVKVSTNVGTAVSATLTWGAGGIPFGPGYQLDLRSPESSFNWVQFLVGLTTLDPSSSVVVFRMQITFVLECYGKGFGALYVEPAPPAEEAEKKEAA